MYAVLGLDESASTNQIEAAYKHLLGTLAADKFKPGPAQSQAEKARVAIEKAHATLIQPDLRRLY
ncbi:DnaJ domain-containing protein, partial [Escherichia coli]